MLSTNQFAVFFDHQCLGNGSAYLLDFLHGDNHQEKVASETNTLDLVWSFCLRSNHIAGFFDHQYVWKGSTDVLNFLHVVRHKAKGASDTTTFDCVWLVCFVANQIAGFFIISISRKNQVKA